MRTQALTFSGLTITEVSQQRGDVNGDGLEDVVMTASAPGGGRVIVQYGEATLGGAFSMSPVLSFVPQHPEVVTRLLVFAEKCVRPLEHNKFNDETGRASKGARPVCDKRCSLFRQIG